MGQWGGEGVLDILCSCLAHSPEILGSRGCVGAGAGVDLCERGLFHMKTLTEQHPQLNPPLHFNCFKENGLKHSVMDDDVEQAGTRAGHCASASSTNILLPIVLPIGVKNRMK